MKLLKLTFIFFLIFLLVSCNNNEKIKDSELNNESVNVKGFTNEPIKEEKTDIELAWCNELIEIWNQKWCMNNSELLKPVEWYKTEFTNIFKNTNWKEWIYFNDEWNKLYTFEYLKKACWTDNEWIIIDNNVKDTCPCPKWFHVPTPNEWNKSYEIIRNKQYDTIENNHTYPLLMFRDKLNINTYLHTFLTSRYWYWIKHNSLFHYYSTREAKTYETLNNKSMVVYIYDWNYDGMKLPWTYDVWDSNGEDINTPILLRCIKNN